LIRHIALFLNFLCPGLGSLLLGKVRTGLVQLLVLVLSILAFTYSFHSFYAVCAIALDWFWGLYSAEWSPRTGKVADRTRA
jgi:TM2 domain-containing membrane protein YozV